MQLYFEKKKILILSIDIYFVFFKQNPTFIKN